MITILILTADVFYFMFCGHHFIYVGDDGIYFLLYLVFGMLWAYVEISASIGMLEAATEQNLRKIQELKNATLGGKK